MTELKINKEYNDCCVIIGYEKINDASYRVLWYNNNNYYNEGDFEEGLILSSKFMDNWLKEKYEPEGEAFVPNQYEFRNCIENYSDYVNIFIKMFMNEDGDIECEKYGINDFYDYVNKRYINKLLIDSRKEKLETLNKK